MRFFRVFGKLLCFIGGLAALMGVLATAVPMIENEQVHNIVASFSTRGESAVINGINGVVQFCLDYNYLVFIVGMAVLLIGGVMKSMAEKALFRAIFLKPAAPKPEEPAQEAPAEAKPTRVKAPRVVAPVPEEPRPVYAAPEAEAAAAQQEPEDTRPSYTAVKPADITITTESDEEDTRPAYTPARGEAMAADIPEPHSLLFPATKPTAKEVEEIVYGASTWDSPAPAEPEPEAITPPAAAARYTVPAPIVETPAEVAHNVEEGPIVYTQRYAPARTQPATHAWQEAEPADLQPAKPDEEPTASAQPAAVSVAPQNPWTMPVMEEYNAFASSVEPLMGMEAEPILQPPQSPASEPAAVSADADAHETEAGTVKAAAGEAIRQMHARQEQPVPTPQTPEPQPVQPVPAPVVFAAYDAQPIPAQAVAAAEPQYMPPVAQPARTPMQQQPTAPVTAPMATPVAQPMPVAVPPVAQPAYVPAQQTMPVMPPQVPQQVVPAMPPRQAAPAPAPSAVYATRPVPPQVAASVEPMRTQPVNQPAYTPTAQPFRAPIMAPTTAPGAQPRPATAPMAAPVAQPRPVVVPPVARPTAQPVYIPSQQAAPARPPQAPQQIAPAPAPMAYAAYTAPAQAVNPVAPQRMQPVEQPTPVPPRPEQIPAPVVYMRREDRPASMQPANTVPQRVQIPAGQPTYAPAAQPVRTASAQSARPAAAQPVPGAMPPVQTVAQPARVPVAPAPGVQPERTAAAQPAPASAAQPMRPSAPQPQPQYPAQPAPVRQPSFIPPVEQNAVPVAYVRREEHPAQPQPAAAASQRAQAPVIQQTAEHRPAAPVPAEPVYYRPASAQTEWQTKTSANERVIVATRQPLQTPAAQQTTQTPQPMPAQTQNAAPAQAVWVGTRPAPEIPPHFHTPAIPGGAANVLRAPAAPAAMERPLQPTPAPAPAQAQPAGVRIVSTFRGYQSAEQDAPTQHNAPAAAYAPQAPYPATRDGRPGGLQPAQPRIVSTIGPRGAQQP